MINSLVIWLAKDLEVAGAFSVHCHFSFPLSFLTRCSSECCLSNKILFTLLLTLIFQSLHILLICSVHVGPPGRPVLLIDGVFLLNKIIHLSIYLSPPMTGS